MGSTNAEATNSQPAIEQFPPSALKFRYCPPLRSACKSLEVAPALWTATELTSTLECVRVLVEQAVAQTLGFKGWNLSNEFEIKHELFHQLALLRHCGLPLDARVPGTPSCRLHAEGKVLNGRPRKADLLLCDPARRQTFNYKVTHIIEIKQSLTAGTVGYESKKFLDYDCAFEGLFIVAPKATKGLAVPETLGTTPLHVLSPATMARIPSTDFTSDASLDLQEAAQEVLQALERTLLLYGRGKQQYHSIFWCNYEHETWRRHSFPCEGDFNARFYHAMRLLLPSTDEIRSEVHPPGDNHRRIDFVIRDRHCRWAIPIDIKMNWDQFKPAIRDRQPKEDEAHVILRRLGDLSSKFPETYPIVVVIQGQWQLPRDIRARALPILMASSYPLEVVMYDAPNSKLGAMLLMQSGRKCVLVEYWRDL